MGDEWDMASDCENDAIEYACELANEEFCENYEKYFVQECAIIAAQQAGNDGGQDDFGKDDGMINDSGDWDSDYGFEGGGDGGGGGDGDGGMLLDILDFLLDVLDALDLFSNISEFDTPHINVPAPKILTETWLDLYLQQIIFGDSAHTRALERAINDIPMIKYEAFQVCLEELEHQLIDEFDGYPEAYVSTIYQDRGNSSLRTINEWDPNLSGILPKTETF